MADIFGYQEADPDSLGPTWRPSRVHALRWRPGWDLAALLDEWEPRLAGLRDDHDSAAVVTLPSRETADVAPLLAHGFSPLVVVAERPAGRSCPSRPSDVRIRPATSADVDVAVELNLHTIRYDEQFGMLRERPNTAELLRADFDPGDVWLAERNGTPIGAITVKFPPHAEWVSSYTEARPIAYIDHLGVHPDERGGGAGSALVTFAHGLLDRAGVASTLLHHALPNPRSTPFWYSHGYQPRWTLWVRRAFHGVSS